MSVEVRMTLLLHGLNRCFREYTYTMPEHLFKNILCIQVILVTCCQEASNQSSLLSSDTLEAPLFWACRSACCPLCVLVTSLGTCVLKWAGGIEGAPRYSFTPWRLSQKRQKTVSLKFPWICVRQCSSRTQQLLAESVYSVCQDAR